MPIQIHPITIDYLAGLLDGEGYIGIRRCVTKGDRSLIAEFKPTMVIANTNYDLMLALKANFKGSICKKQMSTKGTENGWKQSYSFEFNRTEIRRLIPLLEGKLIIKAKQLKLLGALFMTYKHCGIGNAYTPEEVVLKESLHKESLALNKRGILI